MVVVSRSRQLLFKAGLRQKFSYCTLTGIMGIKNSVHKNLLSSSYICLLRTCDFKRFNSSRETRTTLAKLSPQELSNCFLVQSTPVEPSVVNFNKIDSILNYPNARLGIVNAILESHGASLSDIQEIISNAQGSAPEIVAAVNSLLNENLLDLKEDGITVNPDVIRKIVRDSIQSIIRYKLSQNPRIAAVLQNSANQQIDSTAVEPRSVSLSDIQEESSRSKRSLDARAFDLGQIVGDLFSNVLGGQVATLVNSILGTVKTFLEGFLVEVAPGNLIGDTIAGILNAAIKAVLEILTSIQKSLTDITTPTTRLRLKRALGDVINPPADGILDVIIRPVLELISGITTPVNQFLKDIVDTIFKVLQPVIGNTFISLIKPVIVAVINLTVPESKKSILSR